ncbi:MULTISPECIES: RDD family protein [unclassified Salinibacterium]|uniref:RDD family protein n=1 Tax=unclassified Salinibacterium TaxID=2632331 RepID=UPI0018CEFBC8|nr:MULTISPECIES: RDD family protein [unclassified Salinibacterium]MBH0053595.1 RDD family protein [Salinibacterium sp. SWN139]MBH0082870.1 RDD family protein [Salinibacterium sp. SWN167]
MASPQTTNTFAYGDEPDELITGEAVALELHSTSFVLRAAGTMIDFLVYAAALIGLLIGAFAFATAAGLDQAIATALTVSATVICLVVIPTAVETLSRGKSLGKLAIGARIVRNDGGAIGFRHAFIRALIGVLEIFMTAGGLAAIVALLNTRAQRLGDLVAGTYAQYERVSKFSNPVVQLPGQLADWARTADVAKMPDALARRISHFLVAAPGYTPMTRHQHALNLAHEASAYVSPLPAVEPEVLLGAVSALRRERETVALASEKARLAALSPALTGVPRGFPSDRG